MLRKIFKFLLIMMFGGIIGVVLAIIGLVAVASADNGLLSQTKKGIIDWIECLLFGRVSVKTFPHKYITKPGRIKYTSFERIDLPNPFGNFPSKEKAGEIIRLIEEDIECFSSVTEEDIVHYCEPYMTNAYLYSGTKGFDEEARGEFEIIPNEIGGYSIKYPEDLLREDFKL